MTPRRLSPFAAVGLAARGLALLGLVAGLIAGCSSSSPSGPSGPPTLADVRAVMAAHAKALHDRDRDAYVAVASTTSKAAAFRQMVADEYDNLVRVPLRSWTYTVVGALTDSDVTSAARKNWGRPVLVVHLTVSYALDRADPVPTQREIYWTFVRDGAHTVAVGDGDGAAESAISWRGPWDFGHLQVVLGAHCVILGHDVDAQLLPGLSQQVDAAVAGVTAVWGPDWPQYVAVVVPASAAEFNANLGTADGTGDDTADVAALAVTDGNDPVAGTRIGRRLLVSPGELERLSAVGQRIVLRHEITHLAAENATSDSSPTWVVEGFADYVGTLGSGQTPAVTAAELKQAVDAGHAPTALPTSAQFSGDATTAAEAYEGAWLACRLIAARAGPAGLVRFYKAVGASLGTPAQAAAGGLRAVLHESTAAFTAQWRAYVRRELG